MGTLQPATARDLLKTDPKEKGNYRGFSLVHLTAHSVYWLTQWGIPTTYENVSVLNGRLFPADFSMQGFPELPDAFRTNRSLLQMRPKYRGFATSDPREGVHLTEIGKTEAIAVIATIGPPPFEGRVRGSWRSLEKAADLHQSSKPLPICPPMVQEASIFAERSFRRSKLLATVQRNSRGRRPRLLAPAKRRAGFFG